VNRSAPANVTSLTLKGDALYVGGLFAAYGGTPAVALAKLSASTGALDTTFTQASGFTGLAGIPFPFPLQVNALALSSDSLYVAGNFVKYRGVTQDLVAKLDPAFAPVTSLAGSGIEYASSLVNALLISGNQLYLAGAQVTLAGGVSSSGLAKVDLLTGVPDASFCQSVTLLTYSELTPAIQDLVQIGSSIYAGGNFTHPLGTSGAYAQNVAKFDSTTGAIDTVFSQPNGPDGSVYSFAVGGSSLYVNGVFSGYRDAVSPYSIGVDPVSGAHNDK
jgi:hypothetical protein